MADSAAPIFLLCYARSGSTLLRYILDTHPDIAAPPELHLLLTARQLMWVLSHTAAVPGETLDTRQRDQYALERTRAWLSALMSDYADRAGKTRWCEKSVATIDHLDLLDALYPEAQLVCLHRHPLDTMASCLETAQERQGMFGFEPYAARTPTNPVDGLADYWVARTQLLLRCEQDRPDRCLRVRYEDLVNAPAATLESLFGFLQLDWSADLIAAVFTTPHVVGPGDPKILNTTRIESTSIGRGRRLLDRLSQDRLAGLTPVMQKLGYEMNVNHS